MKKYILVLFLFSLYFNIINCSTAWYQVKEPCERQLFKNKEEILEKKILENDFYDLYQIYSVRYFLKESKRKTFYNYINSIYEYNKNHSTKVIKKKFTENFERIVVNLLFN
jgi:hypothetical protein